MKKLIAGGLKSILFILALLFFFAAAFLQYNDPDGWLWAPFYGLTFLVGVVAAIGWFEGSTKRWILVGHLTSILGLSIWVLTHTERAFNPGGSQELYHEAGGLGIALVWNLILFYSNRAK